MTNALTTTTASSPLAPRDMNDAIKLAEMMSRGKLVPQHLQGSPADCLMIIEQAMRWGMSPFAVAQCASSIKGKLMFEGKLVAAAVETSGAIVGGFDYQFSGSGADRKITVSARRAGDSEPKTIEVRLADARTDNPLWTKQPDQQLAYHGVRVWARRWTPAVILGVYSREEIQDEPAAVFAGETIEAVAETPAEVVTLENASTPRAFLDCLEVMLADAPDAAAVDQIVAHPRVQSALDVFKNGARDRLNALVKAALDRTAPGATGAAPDDDDGWPGGGEGLGQVMEGS